MLYTECMKSELDLFKPTSIQTNILKTEEVAYKPLTSLENQSVIEFACYGHGDTYIDLSTIHLRLKIQMVKNDGSFYKEDDADQPGIVNNMLHSLFRQVNVSFNGKNISSSDGHYSYRAYVESILNYGDDAGRTHLELGGWELDTKSLDNLTTNEALKKRASLLKNSKIVEVYGKLHADMLNQPMYLLNGVDLRITLTTNKPEFYIMAVDTDTSILKILDATLYVKHATINPNVLIAHQKMLERTPAQYHYKRCEIKSFTIAPKGSSMTIDNIVLGTLPSRLMFFMVDNDSYNGKRSKNPFNFKHNNITSFALHVNGVQIPNEAIETNFSDESEISARAYSSLFAATGILHTPQGNLITKQMFAHGYYILAFDLTPDLSGSESCLSLVNQGNVRLDARFSSPTNNTINCLLFLEYNATLKIDKNRNIITD